MAKTVENIVRLELYEICNIYLYIIATDVNYTLSTHILRTDVDNADKLRKAICNILVDVPIWGQ